MRKVVSSLWVVSVSTTLALVAVLVLMQGSGPLAFAFTPLGNPAPRVIPSLRDWRGGSGTFALEPTSRILFDSAASAQLSATALTFRDDLRAVTGRTLPVQAATDPSPGDIFLAQTASDPSLGAEGYQFQVQDALVIRGNSETGVFYGTRTALQILQEDASHSHVPRGIARDYPQYPERAFMLDAARKFFPLSELEDYVKLMAWYKMNDFHLHLNDNQLNVGNSANWKNMYAAFRLNSPRFPGLAAKDGSYTQQDMRELQDVAKRYGVTITPEIDAPAHALAFTQYRPELASPTYGRDLLNLENPATYTFMNSIWDEFVPWFDAKEVDIGVDEYATSDADNFRHFINTYDDYLRKKGKTVRMWGSLSYIKSSVAVNTDITTDVWSMGWSNPVEMSSLGFDLINANGDYLYIVPKASYYQDYLDTKELYEKWEPNTFDPAHPTYNLEPGDPHVLGGMFSVWNDRLGTVVTDADVHQRVTPAMQALGQKIWSGPTDTPYSQFEQLTKVLGDAPGTHLP